MSLSVELPANLKRAIGQTRFGWSTTLINIDAISVKHDQRDDNRINDESLIVIIINTSIKQRAERSRALIRAVQPHATLSTREVTSSLSPGRSPRTVLEPHRFSRDLTSRVRERFPCSYPLFHFIWRPSRPVASHKQNVGEIVARPLGIRHGRRDRSSAILRRGKTTIFVVLSISEFFSCVLFRVFALSFSLFLFRFFHVYPPGEILHPSWEPARCERLRCSKSIKYHERDSKNVKDDLVRGFDDTWLPTGWNSSTLSFDKKFYAFRNDIVIREREVPMLRTTLVCLRPMTLRPHEDAMHRNAMQRDATQARG